MVDAAIRDHTGKDAMMWANERGHLDTAALIEASVKRKAMPTV
jgi:hypothetical protein